MTKTRAEQLRSARSMYEVLYLIALAAFAAATGLAIDFCAVTFGPWNNTASNSPAVVLNASQGALLLGIAFLVLALVQSGDVRSLEERAQLRGEAV